LALGAKVENLTGKFTNPIVLSQCLNQIQPG
jgi:hypothetical protein